MHKNTDFITEQAQLDRLKKVIWIVATLVIAFFIVIKSFFNTATSNKKLISFKVKRVNLAIRGSIISEEGFALCYSNKKYKATINIDSIDPQKINLFIKLFSIYSNVFAYDLLQTIQRAKDENKKWVNIATNLNEHQAAAIRRLSVKLQRYKVFIPIRHQNNEIIYAISISENKEDRFYPYGDLLQPVLGYIQTKNNKQKGIKGLEYVYDKQLGNKTDGFYSGDKDIHSYAIFNTNSKRHPRIDGANIQTSINIFLQKRIEDLLDVYKEEFGAVEILASVVRPKDGQIIAIASSNRADVNNIKADDISKLNLNFVESVFEPGSVIKPFIAAIALKNGMKVDDTFDAHNKGAMNSYGHYPAGKIKIGKYTIKDSHKLDRHTLSFEDVVVYSSNIGALQIANKIPAQKLYDGLVKFGFSQKTNKDMAYEHVGALASVKNMRIGESSGRLNIYKATLSYGYGMNVNFMQLLKAFNVINNDGVMSNLSIVKYDKTKTRVIDNQTNKIVHDILHQVVIRGTGKNADKIGLEIGGKTGTARISANGGYGAKYNSSFFGFANDEQNKYTIGVSVFGIPKENTHKYYYASQSAAVVFGDIVEQMLSLGMLRRNLLQDE